MPSRVIDYPRAGRTGAARWVPSWKLVTGLLASGLLALVLVFVIAYAAISVPDPRTDVANQSSIVYYADGKTELGRFSITNRTIVPLSAVPQHLQRAVVAAEDRTFYENSGVSPTAIARALWTDLRGGARQGGSTITQQYVKNYFLSSDETLTRKFKEFFIALKVDKQQSKEEILQNYLNTIYYGRGAYGIQAASQAYFGKDVGQLSVAEGALLAGVINGPGYFDPAIDPTAAKARWDYVLDGMVTKGWLSPTDRAAMQFPQTLPPRQNNAYAGPNGYLLQTVRTELNQRANLTDKDLDGGGLRIVSTFDKASQDAAVAAVQKQLPTQGAQGIQAGLVAMNPQDGSVVAMYGGADYLKRQRNAATQDIAQAGSTFKPFTLVAALENGVSLRETFNGRNKQTFPGFPGPVVNFSNESFGHIDLRTATANSVNTVFAALNLQVGPEKTREAAVRAGLPDKTVGLDKPGNPSNVLGTASPHVIDLAQAYSTFANDGTKMPWFTVKEVKDSSGAVRYQHKVQGQQVIDPRVTADLDSALEGVIQRGSGTYARALGRPAAGKTGTSTNNNSAWFAGYTHQQLAAVIGIYRVGPNNEVQSLQGLGGIKEVTGGSFPVRIWTAFMQAALKGKPVAQFPPPSNLNAPTFTLTPTSPPTTSSSSTTSSTTTTSTPPPTSTTKATIPSVTIPGTGGGSPPASP